MTTRNTSRTASSANGSRPSPRAAGRRVIEIMDTTLRDGEQTDGISIMPEEKLIIARQLLKSLKVDRVEVASARVSPGELDAVNRIMRWAKSEKLTDRIEVLGFVDGNASVDWVGSVGCRVINLLTKGSERHCREQLRRTPEQHIAEIFETVRYGKRNGVSFNVYLEDWSGGMLGNPGYVDDLIEALIAMPVDRIMLCDTLGILNPRQVAGFVGRYTGRHPEAHFDFHGHNDYGLATANSLEAVLAGARGIHVTTNGIGERAGNTCMDEVVVCMRDHAGLRTNVAEKRLRDTAHLVEVFTGRRISANKPITGENVFTQTAGIHADGDMKGNLYESRLKPARFGRARQYSMGKLMGKASLEFNLEKMKIRLTPEQKKTLMNKIVALGDQKKVVTAEDLPFILTEVLESPEHRVFEVLDYMVSSTRGLMPTATIRVRCRGEEHQASANGDGGYDAFMKALKSIEKKMGLRVPALEDYEVHIPPGGRTDALVETTIRWEGGLKTRAVHSDQLAAAIEATAHVMNVLALRESNGAEA